MQTRNTVPIFFPLKSKLQIFKTLYWNAINSIICAGAATYWVCQEHTGILSILRLVSENWGHFYKNPAFQQALSLNSNVVMLLNSEIW